MKTPNTERVRIAILDELASISTLGKRQRNTSAKSETIADFMKQGSSSHARATNCSHD